MNAAQRRIYFTQIWPAACRAQGWDRRDDMSRRGITALAMKHVGGRATTSTTELDPAEVTALFTYLRHLAAPEDLRRLSAWMDCQADFRTFNTTRQAEFWRAKAGYRPRGRIERQRFGGRPYDGLYGDPRMSAAEADQYLLTMRTRAKRHAAVVAAGADDDPF
jgi:hypothetical protein